MGPTSSVRRHRAVPAEARAFAFSSVENDVVHRDVFPDLRCVEFELTSKLARNVPRVDEEKVRRGNGHLQRVPEDEREA